MDKTSSLDFTLTLACNNNCVFCPREALKPLKVSVKDTLAALKKAQNRPETILTGGEPTILKSLPAIASACKAAGAARVGIITNGRALSNPAYMKRLVAHGVTSFTVSLYSHLPEIHDRLTRAPGSCAQTWRGLANVAALSRTGLIAAGVNMVLCSENIRSAAKTLSSCKQLGITQFLRINQSGPRISGLFNYSLLGRFLRAVLKRRKAYPDKLILRGFPLCTSPAGIHAENQDIGGAGGVPRSRLSGYYGVFSGQFLKPGELCRGCAISSRCNGVSRAYFRNYGLSGLL